MLARLTPPTVALTPRLVVTVAEVVWGLVALGTERHRRERRDRPGLSSATTEPASPNGSANEAEPSG